MVLARLSVATSPSLPLALPVAGQTVNATMDGVPVTNATVTVGGEPTARTGAAGQATVGMPLAASAKTSVSKYGQTATTTVGGLLVNAAGVVRVWVFSSPGRSSALDGGRHAGDAMGLGSGRTRTRCRGARRRCGGGRDLLGRFRTRLDSLMRRS